MAHFRGLVAGNRSEASRLGSKNSGMRVEAQSWQGKVVVTLYHLTTANSAETADMALVELKPHHGAGRSVILYNGPVSGLGAVDGRPEFGSAYGQPLSARNPELCGRCGERPKMSDMGCDTCASS